MSRPLHVLIVEDAEDDALLLVRELRRGGYEPRWERVETWAAMQDALMQQRWDLIIADYALPRFSAPEALRLLQQRGLDLPFIIVSGAIGEETAVAAMRAGAHDYLLKGQLARLSPAVERELREAGARSARKCGEAALHESEERFRTIFEEALIGMVVVGLDDQVLKVNKAFCEMLGYTEQELTTLTFAALIHPDDVAKDLRLAKQIFSHELTTYSLERRFIRKNREILWATFTATVIRDRERQILYRLSMIANITDRKRAELLLEAERRRVAYELHDGLAQVVASTHQHLQAFAKHYHPRTPKARQALDQVLRLAQHASKEVRRTIAGLRPTVLDAVGLATALHLQLEELRLAGWEITYEQALGSERLPPAIETALFGVAQEALSNSRKHAGKTRLRLALERQSEAVRLEVQDWGRGFQPSVLWDTAEPGERVGLLGMRERVALLDGDCSIHSQPGAGTLVVVVLPLPTLNQERITDEQYATYTLEV